MTPTEKLLEWHTNWKIIDETISCKICGAMQHECDREKTFVHMQGCVKASLGIHPWVALDEVQKTFSSG